MFELVIVLLNVTGTAAGDTAIDETDDDAEETDRIRVVDMIENKVLAGKHYGSTDNIMDTYAELVEISQKNNYDIIGSPKEVLIKNFHNCDDEEEFVTEIQLPIIEM
jgi:effector-binding domain-containing protein